MIDIQLLINITLFVITILFVVVLIQVVFLLKELKTSLIKANKILDDSGEISENIKQPVIGLSKFLVGLKSGASLINIFKKLKED